MHTSPASQSRREYSTCGQRATGTGLGLPPVIEHVGGLLKRPHPLEQMILAAGEVGAQLLVWDQLMPAAQRRRGCASAPASQTVTRDAAVTASAAAAAPRCRR